MNDEPVTHSEVLEEVAKLEKRLGLTEGFYANLRKEGDWEFIIKTHALLETTISTLLEHHFEDNRIHPVLGRMNLNGPVSKIALCAALELMDGEERKIVEQVSKIRNRFVHDISGISLSLSSYVESMNQGGKDQFADAVTYSFPDQLTLSKDDKKIEISAKDFVLKSPKLGIWKSCIFILGMNSMRIEIAEHKRKTTELLEDRTTLLTTLGKTQPST